VDVLVQVLLKLHQRAEPMGASFFDILDLSVSGGNPVMRVVKTAMIAISRDGDVATPY